MIVRIAIHLLKQTDRTAEEDPHQTRLYRDHDACRSMQG